MRPKIRSKDRITFAYRQADTDMGVSRATVINAAKNMGMDETGFLHLATAQFVRSIKLRQAAQSPQNSKSTPDDADARLTDRQIEAVRSMNPQDRVATRSFLDLIYDKKEA